MKKKSGRARVSKKHAAAPKKQAKRYQRPDVRTLSREDVLSAIGPAQAMTSGVTDPSCGDGRHRRR